MVERSLLRGRMVERSLLRVGWWSEPTPGSDGGAEPTPGSDVYSELQTRSGRSGPTELWGSRQSSSRGARGAWAELRLRTPVYKTIYTY
ncbi:hypothetical protein NDU88_000132 [Pleurodeles waltl]|uniref:Uncharacterized protein n=1 Tax=Pleurodeles waltl TaxID=8319 RepID=A0AAV7P007_PLEWA|nr:hypothetical protein NDU88_000132 [Pleurodeles waltl]